MLSSYPRHPQQEKIGLNRVKIKDVSQRGTPLLLRISDRADIQVRYASGHIDGVSMCTPYFILMLGARMIWAWPSVVLWLGSVEICSRVCISSYQQKLKLSEGFSRGSNRVTAAK